MSFAVMLYFVIPALNISTNHHATKFAGLGRSRGHTRSASFIPHACTKSRYSQRRHDWETCEEVGQDQEAHAIPGPDLVLNWIPEVAV